MVSGQDLAALVQVSKQRLFHLGMNNGQVLLGAELAEGTVRHDPEKLGGVHSPHVAVLGEAVAAILFWVEEGREAAVHVEGLVVKPLENFLANVRLKGVFCMVGCND